MRHSCLYPFSGDTGTDTDFAAISGLKDWKIIPAAKSLPVPVSYPLDSFSVGKKHMISGIGIIQQPLEAVDTPGKISIRINGKASLSGGSSVSCFGNRLVTLAGFLRNECYSGSDTSAVKSRISALTAISSTKILSSVRLSRSTHPWNPIWLIQL